MCVFIKTHTDILLVDGSGSKFYADLLSWYKSNFALLASVWELSCSQTHRDRRTGTVLVEGLDHTHTHIQQTDRFQIVGFGPK